MLIVPRSSISLSNTLKLYILVVWISVLCSPAPAVAEDCAEHLKQFCGTDCSPHLEHSGGCWEATNPVSGCCHLDRREPHENTLEAKDNHEGGHQNKLSKQSYTESERYTSRECTVIGERRQCTTKEISPSEFWLIFGIIFGLAALCLFGVVAIMVKVLCCRRARPVVYGALPLLPDAPPFGAVPMVDSSSGSVFNI